MTGFFRQQSTLVCDDVSVAAIGDAAGTPVYVYSADAIRESYRAIDAALGSYPHTLHYALKANSSLALIRLLRELGSAADANSGGEIEVALRAGFTPPDIVLTGVGKTRRELEQAVSLGIHAINAESPGEVERIAEVARNQGRRARVALRVNPDIDALSHPHISTGLRANKFGVPLEAAAAIYRSMVRRPELLACGIHVHVGSQILSLEPLRRAAASIVRLACELRADRVPIEYLDVGGGLGVSYDGSPAPTAREYASVVLEEIRGSGLAVELEPGRAIMAAAGALVARVVDVKQHPSSKRFVVLDTGMTELLRPALYGAYHRIQPVVERPGPHVACDVVGPICESSDVFGSDRVIAPVDVGDLIAILDTGAYGAAMGSTYNRRPLPAEVLVDGGSWRVIRRRQTIEELIALEE